MYSKIKITVVSLVVAMICMLGSTMTLAYFTDTDGTTNNFVVGNASTGLKVYDDISGSKHELVASDYTVVDGGVYKGGVALSDVPFYLQARNSGNIPVYQRFRVVIPKNLANLVTVVFNGDCTITGTSTCSDANYDITYNPSVHSDTYAEYYITSKAPLEAGAVTHEWPTTKLRFNGITNVNKDLFACTGDNNHCMFGLGVYSDVIQTAGFTGIEQAFSNFTETYD